MISFVGKYLLQPPVTILSSNSFKILDIFLTFVSSTYGEKNDWINEFKEPNESSEQDEHMKDGEIQNDN